MSGTGPAIFCMSTYEKGQPFLREAARLGCSVSLLTVDKLRDGDWPKDVLANFFTMPSGLTQEQILNTVTFFARTLRIDRIVALDEFDLEIAALLREHMRLPGMNQSKTRFFRDKLAMRTEAQRAGVLVPEFTRVLRHDDLRSFMAWTQGPWLLKPRTNAASLGIKLVHSSEELWPILDTLGDMQSHYLMERFVPGEVFHAEGITWNGELIFEAPCKYGKPPMQTMHHGGVFTTRTLAADSPDARAISEVHRAVLKALQLEAGVSHTEFIRAQADGRVYFLESAARVGGAHISDVIELARGINPWVEWARLEVARAKGEAYMLPSLRNDFAGSMICLARQERPDLSAYADPEVSMRLERRHHAGVIVRSHSEDRVKALVEEYGERFLNDFCATMPAPDRPSA
ncbi:ATPase [Granulicella sp. WH15]|nr:ATPase [Granulicella sp. WH15]